MNSKEVPMPVVVAVIVVILVVIGGLAWKFFAPAGDPQAGMTQEEKIARAKKAIEEHKKANESAPGEGGLKMKAPGQSGQ